MVYTEYTKKRILHYNECNFSTSEILKAFEKEGIKVSRAGVWKFLKRYEETGQLERKGGSGWLSVLSDEVKHIIETAMTMMMRRQRHN